MSICPTFGDVKIDEWIMGVVNFHSMVLAAIDDYCVSSLFGVVKWHFSKSVVLSEYLGFYLVNMKHSL